MTKKPQGKHHYIWLSKHEDSNWDYAEWVAIDTGHFDTDKEVLEHHISRMKITAGDMLVKVVANTKITMQLCEED